MLQIRSIPAAPWSKIKGIRCCLYPSFLRERRERKVLLAFVLFVHITCSCFPFLTFLAAPIASRTGSDAVTPEERNQKVWGANTRAQDFNEHEGKRNPVHDGGSNEAGGKTTT